jgi:hypothetical protein
MALRKKHLETAQVLVEVRADVDRHTLVARWGREDTTPLLKAVREGYEATDFVLNVLGAEPNAEPAAGCRPALYEAAYLGNVEVVEVLLDSGADCIMKETALHAAVEWCSRHPIQRRWDEGRAYGLRTTLHPL